MATTGVEDRHRHHGGERPDAGHDRRPLAQRAHGEAGLAVRAEEDEEGRDQEGVGQDEVDVAHRGERRLVPNELVGRVAELADEDREEADREEEPRRARGVVRLEVVAAGEGPERPGEQVDELERGGQREEDGRGQHLLCRACCRGPAPSRSRRRPRAPGPPRGGDSSGRSAVIVLPPGRPGPGAPRPSTAADLSRPRKMLRPPASLPSSASTCSELIALPGDAQLLAVGLGGRACHRVADVRRHDLSPPPRTASLGHHVRSAPPGTPRPRL